MEEKDFTLLCNAINTALADVGLVSITPADVSTSMDTVFKKHVAAAYRSICLHSNTVEKAWSVKFINHMTLTEWVSECDSTELELLYKYNRGI